MTLHRVEPAPERQPTPGEQLRALADDPVGLLSCQENHHLSLTRDDIYRETLVRHNGVPRIFPDSKDVVDQVRQWVKAEHAITGRLGT